MTIIVADANGISDCTKGYEYWILVHDGVNELWSGKCGQVTTKHTVEYFDTEAGMEDRIDALNLVRLVDDEE